MVFSQFFLTTCHLAFERYTQLLPKTYHPRYVRRFHQQDGFYSAHSLLGDTSEVLLAEDLYGPDFEHEKDAGVQAVKRSQVETQVLVKASRYERQVPC